MSSKEQVLIVDEDSGSGSPGRRHEKVFAPSTFVFDAGLEEN